MLLCFNGKRKSKTNRALTYCEASNYCELYAFKTRALEAARTPCLVTVKVPDIIR